MNHDRRKHLRGILLAFGAVALMPRSSSQVPQRPPRPDEPPGPPLKPNPKDALKRNQQEIKRDVLRLAELAEELKAEVEKTDSAEVLSLGLVRKAEEIEKLAKHIKSLAKG